MQSPSADYNTANAAPKKKPAYLIHLDGESIDYVTTTRIGSHSATLKSYMQLPRGNSQSITPEQGQSTIGQIVIPLLDKYGEITALLGGHATNLHRVKTTVKAGYQGLDESDMLEAFTGWVTDIKLWKDGLGYDVTVTDTMRRFQRQLFRGAEDSAVTLEGNPMNILLRCLLSTGAGANGHHDWYPEEWGLGIDQDLVRVSHIEHIRDTWLRGISFFYDIRKRITAKNFFEEIFMVCNCYPIIRGDGTFDVIKYHEPLPVALSTQAFDESVIIGLPSWDQNLSGMINECEFHIGYDSDANEYAAQYFYEETDSIADRWAGVKPLKIQSKGLPNTARARTFIERRANTVFQRYAVPPPKLKLKTFYSRHLSDVGDIVPVTHSKLPNLATGARGITNHYMEIIDRSASWQKGECDFTLLATDWKGERYICLAPNMTVVSGIDTTSFYVTEEDAAKYEVGWHIDLCDSLRRIKAGNLEITEIVSHGMVTLEDTADVEFDDTADVEFESGAGYKITVGSSIGETPAAGWIVKFADDDYLTAAQQLYWIIKTTGSHLILA